MSSFFDPHRSLEQRRQAVANLWDFVVKGGVADTRRTPSEVIDDARKGVLHRYQAPAGVTQSGTPVLLVPPLGAQATCFDLRRGNSYAEHLLSTGRPTYLVDYGSMSTISDRDVGIEFFFDEVIPNAVEKITADSGAEAVNLVGWCMGGLISLGTVAAHPELPVNAVGMVASPFDMSKNPMLAPVRAIGRFTDGNLIGTAFKVLGGVPARVVGPAFKATSVMTYVKKPMTLFKYRDDRDFLAQVEAVDELMNNMYAYPGKATVQAYQRLAIRNELATGRIQGEDRVIDLADVTVPVINIAGTSDVLVPIPVAHHVSELLPNAAEVRVETAPGGHLGVLTGRSAVRTTWPMLDEFLAAHEPAAAAS